MAAFIVLIERRTACLARVARRVLAVLAMAVCAIPLGAHAQLPASNKVASDLAAVVAAASTPSVSWARDVGGVRYVKALIVSSSGDPNLVALRSAVLAAGGSVYMRYVSVAALSVLLPAAQVNAVAARSDVQSMSPNRLTARTASLLEQTTGAANVRGGSANPTGLDGSGVGIAVLDSGILEQHFNLLAADGKTQRVKRAVDFLQVADATAAGVKDWTPGLDASSSLVPGSAAMTGYESRINALTKSRPDAYGHGTHVASVAAGRGAYQSVDSTGVAPNANLYDVKVLDGNGYGQLSDVLAGIDWVIYHAREFNIRVINLSLASDSTESYLTDPLCRAVRSAVAAGIVVVAAAGNYGLTAGGVEQYGAVSAPGKDRKSVV